MPSIEEAGYYYKIQQVYPTISESGLTYFPAWLSQTERTNGVAPGQKRFYLRVTRTKRPDAPPIIAWDHLVSCQLHDGGSDWIVPGSTGPVLGTHAEEIDTTGVIHAVTIPVVGHKAYTYRLKWHAKLQWPNTTVSEQEWCLNPGKLLPVRECHAFGCGMDFVEDHSICPAQYYTYLGNTHNSVWPSLGVHPFAGSGDIQILNWTNSSVTYEVFTGETIQLNNSPTFPRLITLSGKGVGVFDNGQTSRQVLPGEQTTLKFRIEPNNADSGVVVVRRTSPLLDPQIAILPLRNPTTSQNLPRITIRSGWDERIRFGDSWECAMGHQVEVPSASASRTKALTVKNEDKRALQCSLFLGKLTSTSNDNIGGGGEVMDLKQFTLENAGFESLGVFTLNAGQSRRFEIRCNSTSGAVFIYFQAGVPGTGPGAHLLVPVMVDNFPSHGS